MSTINQAGSFNRLNRRPLDVSSTFENATALENYLLTGPAYIGQVVAIAGNPPQVFVVGHNGTRYVRHAIEGGEGGRDWEVYDTMPTDLSDKEDGDLFFVKGERKTFTVWKPNVAANGLLTWEQSLDSDPPTPRNIRGTDGTNGINGLDAAITGATAIALVADSTPTVTMGGTPQARTFQFGIPRNSQPVFPWMKGFYRNQSLTANVAAEPIADYNSGTAMTPGGTTTNFTMLFAPQTGVYHFSVRNQVMAPATAGHITHIVRIYSGSTMVEDNDRFVQRRTEFNTVNGVVSHFETTIFLEANWYMIFSISSTVARTQLHPGPLPFFFRRIA